MIIFSKLGVIGAAVIALATSCDGPSAGTNEDTTPDQERAVTDTPESGEVRTAGALLGWERRGTDLSYRLLYEAPNACYSAGAVTPDIGPSGNDVVINAEIAFQDAVCAQMITVVKFEGTVSDLSGPFTLTANMTERRNGTVISLTAK